VIALPTEIEGWRVITTVTSDITAVIVAQEERQHLAALQEEMLQNVSHELRTPLTVIIGLSEILEKGFLGEIAEQQKAAAKTILQRAVDMHHLTNAMIALIAPVFKERFSVPDVVMSVVLAAGATANRLGIDIQYDYHNGLKIHGDLNLVKAAIAALVDNAIKFSQRGGIVVIAVKRDNLGLSVIVTDQGIGIAPENRERIFNRFVQISDGTTRLYGGVGLGLSVVERAIEAHGGRVDLVSEVNEGSTFTLWLPYGSDSD
jgi:signal transduction histidine kinase